MTFELIAESLLLPEVRDLLADSERAEQVKRIAAELRRQRMMIAGHQPRPFRAHSISVVDCDCGADITVGQKQCVACGQRWNWDGWR